jgi:predicted ATPase
VNGVPLQPTRIVGRDRELQIARQLVLDGATRLVTLSGAGGIGKTRLAIELARELSTHFADGVWFVDLSSISDPQLVLPAITQGLGLQEDPDRPVLARLVSYLSQRDLLLLLDNFEHVLSAGAQLADLLASVPELKLVVTSVWPAFCGRSQAERTDVAPDRTGGCPRQDDYPGGFDW